VSKRTVSVEWRRYGGVINLLSNFGAILDPKFAAPEVQVSPGPAQNSV
jgi:hypothetical protein